MTLFDGLRLLQQGQWDAAHRIAQADASQPGSWLHGIVHMAEPDESNSHYWYRAAGRPFPGMAALQAEMAAFEKAWQAER
ncbi:MAG: hypothetical protein FJ011_01930 [Chloroflexi bacterium]|nr:hypothetical protein [Chloroflexota bacterium]